MLTRLGDLLNHEDAQCLITRLRNGYWNRFLAFRMLSELPWNTSYCELLIVINLSLRLYLAESAKLVRELKYAPRVGLEIR